MTANRQMIAVILTFRKCKKNDWSVWPEIIGEVGKNTLYLESIILRIMAIVSVLIRNHAMGLDDREIYVPFLANERYFLVPFVVLKEQHLLPWLLVLTFLLATYYVNILLPDIALWTL